MAYPGSFFNWKDNSAIPSIPEITSVSNAPLFFALFTSDYGTEDPRTFEGTDFFDMYGTNISFSKHGQPLLQAAAQINNGAKLFCKRVVASDAKLGNSGVVGHVKKATSVETPKTDTSGNALYYGWTIDNLTHTATLNKSAEITDATTTNNTGSDVTYTNESGAETTCTSGDTIPNVAVTETVNTPATVSFEIVSIKEVSTMNEAVEKFKKLLSTDGDDKAYPLFIFTDNGRGESIKSWAIAPQYDLSKNSKNMVYQLTITTPTKTDAVYFTFNPDYIIDGKSYSIQQRVYDTTVQLKCKQLDSNMADFAQAIVDARNEVAEADGTDVIYTYDTMINEDLLFGYDRSGKASGKYTEVEYVDFKDDSTMALDLFMGDAAGHTLDNGSNGSFGNRPVNATTYAAELANALDAENNPGAYPMYDVQNNRFIAVFDANYPEVVKRAIEKMAMAREDFMYFRDFGTTGNTNLASIIAYADGAVDDNIGGIADTRFEVPCPMYWDIIDPYTKKQITVTMTYSMAIKFINHYIGGVNRPFCGLRYGVTFPEVIDGTVSFTPVNVLNHTEKEDMCDRRLNYVGYYNGVLTLETCYTAQSDYTQLSFASNVMAVQDVVRSIRAVCPEIRYALATEAGLAAYSRDINDRVISKYTDWFDQLSFEYVGDSITLANKRYYAAISFKFTDFIQSEHFTITALPSISEG